MKMVSSVKIGQCYTLITEKFILSEQFQNMVTFPLWGW